MGMVTFVDETTAGERHAGGGLDVAEGRLALREVIRRRVFQEVAECNSRTTGVFRGLVRPTDAERTLNGYELRTPRRIDPERQFRQAVEAFGRNGFLVLVGEWQIEDLDAEVDLSPGTEVTFLKLVPLAGG
ncbi:hypothetical protein AB0B50_18030 [Streptomyces sp. NPDC041068]|uniref:hypothetical protein n=1 Tax=Streptomyces sp. NPDC041068 TaxID=3155130 RepID=UPI0033FC1DD4